VRVLLRDQHPDLADHPVRLGARGWDNQLWRLGDDLAVRLPWATQSADTLLRNEHVRIDILSGRLSKRARDWIDLVCHILFLAPFTGLMAWLCWPWFWRSYTSGEMSANAGGLAIWPAKLVVLIGFLLLSAQVISEIVKRVAVLRGDIEDPTPIHELPPAAEAAIEMEAKSRD
jgi:TRAP-type mannitol/chloroaromatic compound transport system permease small subunit